MARTALRHLCIQAFSLLSCCLWAISVGPVAAQTPANPTQATSTLTVQVTGIRNAKGTIQLTLYRDSKHVATQTVGIDAKTLTAKAIFSNIPQGTYAVELFHDENSNGNFDLNFLGIPIEGYGMSNNPRKRVGRPSFDETNFPVNQPQCAIEIKMIYW